MTEGIVPLAKTMCQASPYVDLNHLKRFAEQIAERYIEHIRANDVVERHVGEKDMPLLLKRQAEAAEPIVIDVGEKPLGSRHVGNKKASPHKPGDLGGVS